MCSKKIVFVFTGLGFVLLTIYMAKFRHPPADVILAVNNRMKQTIVKLHSPGDPDYDPYDEAERTWDNFIVANGYVPIGSIFDNCDVSDRFMVGKVIILPDLVYGGVMSRMFINISLEETLTGGTFFIQTFYNGHDIFENHFEICNKDSNKQYVTCPVLAAYITYDQVVKIPGFIPKGHYTVKARVEDLHKRIIACAFADFFL